MKPITIDRAVIQQALEALESLFTLQVDYARPKQCGDAITALRAALEQPEQTNPWRDAVDDELVSLHMVASDDPRESIRRLIDWHCAVQIDPLVSSAAQELIERGKREALEQPEQPEQPEQEPVDEPVAMRWDFDGYGYRYIDSGSGSNWQTRHADAEPLYTHPPRREWRGLTEEDTTRAWESMGRGLGKYEAFARAIEAALKEKNHECL